MSAGSSAALATSCACELAEQLLRQLGLLVEHGGGEPGEAILVDVPDDDVGRMRVVGHVFLQEFVLVREPARASRPDAGRSA